ncbi:MAG TPA: DUF4255 domain-containing protein [Leptolyngbyaceae cyanobacterium M33_DOE_097]|uniref:DUF4255 domain-containing protein n=1 Tax=Oscillatoriales cyanobacterium SpSt-418 TaxID=2282169 RepID=A0A7C3PGT7_9CYAN|nr:DUF4255 domain-containing protein [Leptolyngbyaceae cyanobacterium M33_DOE_097]
MSNYLAIATVTATLQRLLQASAQADVDGARVTTVRPDTAGGSVPETGINLFLYRVAPNPAWRNADLRTRTSDGQFSKRPQAALDLFYLLTCFGNEIELEPHRLMGSAIRTLHAQPVLTTAMIQAAIATPGFSFLQASNLADQVESVKLMPLPLSTDELSNLWSTFFQTPYALSIAYQVGVVLIESDDIPQRALPVRDRRFAIMPNQPMVELAISTDGAREPITMSTRLRILGSRLRGEQTQVRIGQVEVTPTKVEDREILLDLAGLDAAPLSAGVQSLQVVHRTAADPLRGTESNVVPFVLRPLITQIVVGEMEDDGDDRRTGELRLSLNPPLLPGQRVSLHLNEQTDRSPSAYSFDEIKRATNSGEIAFLLRDVKPGNYLVRVQVDGAESRLEVDTTPTSPTFEQYVGPQVVIP